MVILLQIAVIMGSLIPPYSAQTYGDVRLANEDDTTGPGVYGIVEVYLGDRWGTVHYNGSDSDGPLGAGLAVCRQLGFHTAIVATEFPALPPYDPTPHVPAVNDSVPVLLTILGCPYYDNIADIEISHILRCSHQLEAVESYDRNGDIVVGCKFLPRCESYRSACVYDTQVRLVQGGTDYTSSGFVEVYLHDSWGPVCNLGRYDADIVCRQLGYTNAVGHGYSDSYVSENVTDWLDEFKCHDSSFPCLRNCFAYPDINDTVNCIQHSWVNCTYDERSSDQSAGDFILCSTATTPTPTTETTVKLEVILAAVGFVVLVLLIAIVTLLCCCCVPGCPLHDRRKRSSYKELHDQMH